MPYRYTSPCKEGYPSKWRRRWWRSLSSEMSLVSTTKLRVNWPHHSIWERLPVVISNMIVYISRTTQQCCPWCYYPNCDYPFTIYFTLIIDAGYELFKMFSFQKLLYQWQNSLFRFKYRVLFKISKIDQIYVKIDTKKVINIFYKSSLIVCLACFFR